ncbi:MAG TPA: hypothetical protein VMD79_16250 [Solirubrobacteraceae bacterium]|nr:hypothetical protein [Solirubrobacteraceae bacterium]
MRRSLHSCWSGARAGATLALALALLALTLAPASPAAAAGFEGTGALGNLTEGAPEEPSTSTAAKGAAGAETETTTHNSGSVVAVVIAIGAALLAGVAFVIVRDARRWAPAADGELVEGGGARHSPAVMRKRRAKAKAARKQRKRNR